MSAAYEDAFLRPSRYLEFERVPTPGRKTTVWNVRSQSSGAILGTISWHGPWRQYAFWPAGSTLFNCECMADIIDRIETLMRWRKNVAANRAGDAT